MQWQAAMGLSDYLIKTPDAIPDVDCGLWKKVDAQLVVLL